MRKEAALPVRLESAQKEDLLRIGAELGLSSSAILRVLMKSFIDHYDRNNGRIEFPLEMDLG